MEEDNAAVKPDSQLPDPKEMQTMDKSNQEMDTKSVDCSNSKDMDERIVRGEESKVEDCTINKFDVPIREQINKRLPRSQRKRLIREQRREKRQTLKQENVLKRARNENKTEVEKADSSSPADDNSTQSSTPSGSVEESYTSKRIRLQQAKERCQEALKSGQRIAVDLSLEQHMNVKECGKLAQQLCRLYGANRRSSKPAHIYFTGLSKDGDLYKECVRKNSGFEGYMVDILEEPHYSVFPNEDIVYLTPDSENVLETVEKDKVYVIGGLVDESITNNITHSKAREIGIQTARLPIEEKMAKDETGTFIKVLSVNQVFEILLELSNSGDWSKALSSNVPRRTGYFVK